MRNFPTPWTVGLHRYSGGGARNAHNSPIKSWTPPKGEPGQQVKVIGWGPSGPSYEPTQDRSVERVEMYIPAVLRDANGDPVADPGPMDVIDLPDPSGLGRAQYEVLGWPRDYTHGFHGWAAGKVVDLQRVAG